MKSAYKLRLARQPDKGRLREIEIEAAQRFKKSGVSQDLLQGNFCQDKLQALISFKQVWVVETAKELVGFVAVSVFDSCAYIEEIDVTPKHGQHGLGTKLMQQAIKWAKKQRLRMVLLSTFRSIAWNAPFYERLGFITLSSRKLSKRMHQIRHHERKAGLPIKDRVFMTMDLTDGES